MMRTPSLISLTFLCGLCGCGPEHALDDREAQPDQDMSFDRLYRKNCSGCHGGNGSGGPALDLDNPAYQALIDDDSLKKWIVHGRPGSQMPAFGEAAGGLLTEKQIDALVLGIRKKWGTNLPNVEDAPPYAPDVTGSATRGDALFQAACASCHGELRHRVTDTTYLALVSNQALRTIIIAGRPDLGHPGCRELADRGHRLTNHEVADLVAYLDSLRSATPGEPYPRSNIER